MLDATGGLHIGNRVVLASDVHVITASHEPNSDEFSTYHRSVRIEEYAWVASRATVLPGVTVGRGAVVAAGAVVNTSIQPMTIAAGVPARKVGQRRSRLRYTPTFWPRFY